MYIKYISSYVPRNNRNFSYFRKKLGKNYKRIINYTGFKKIHIIKKNTSIDDFIFKSLNSFIKNNNINKKEIDCLIYSSHTRLNEMPNYSITLQKKLNLSNQILAYDLPNSCSAFTNGLIHSNALLKSGTSKNILLICADFHSTKLKDTNKNLTPVIGDGMSCILIKKDNRNSIKFDYGVDGQNNSILKIEKNILSMDGIKVFEFASSRVPLTISKVLKKYKNIKSKINYVVLHQPNKSIFENLQKKIDFKIDKFISSYDHGNLSAASIPVNLCKNFPNKKIKKKLFLFVGFGSGLSWSSVIVNLNDTKVNKIIYL